MLFADLEILEEWVSKSSI